MPSTLEVLFAPAEFEALRGRELNDSVCVVFDVFRATSTIVTALANGAAAVIPVAEIADALALRAQRPDILLAGERNGLRIHRGLTGGIDFDLGNSPREFTRERVNGKSIVLSTTNGSRALRACAHAQEVLVGSFPNLSVTADYVRQNPAANLLLVCSGTGSGAAYEDSLGAGALVDLIWTEFAEANIADSARAARAIYKNSCPQLLNAASNSRNGRRLSSIPDLRDDVAWCLERDRFPLLAKLKNGSAIKFQ